ncbi:MAG: HEPN domain-containing protein [Treponema sp.]|jgi:HEPN domain-containing protein|nr:HEPN domain-containing protein [Treponema sp.]
MDSNEILQQWLHKGNDDLRSAEYLSTMHYPTPDEVICHLCQQSAEKYLKGFLFLHDIEPPKTHDLNELLEMCVTHNVKFSVLLSKTNILTSYAVIPRYPNDLGITSEDMRTAIQYAKDIQELVLKATKGD